MNEEIFISGIYNYCDRWCEKCFYTNRCLLFNQEIDMEIKQILRDDDKNNPNIMDEDMKNSLHSAFKNINKFMDEEDEQYEEFEMDDFEFDDDNDETEFEKEFFKEKISDEERPSTFLKNADNPLILLSEKLFNDFYKYYDLFKSKFPDELEEKNSQSPLQQNLDILGWYTPQLHVKIRMSYWNKHKLSKSKDPEFAEIDEEMLNINSRIAFIAIEKCIAALNFLYQQKTELQKETKALLNNVLQIRNIFIEEFPNAPTFKRPYFD